MNPNQPKSAWQAFAVALASFALIASAAAEWKEQVLYSFPLGSSEGYYPAGGVVFDRQGNLYGATTEGGPQTCTPIAGACGTVFELSPPAQKGSSWTETLVYQFQGEEPKDGSVPTGGVVFDAAGNLYGVTAYGGTGNCELIGVLAGCGTVYELSPPTQQGGSWTETILYSFQGGNDGYFPWDDLVLDKKGNLYGATQFGGGKGTSCNGFYGGQCGAVFKLSPPTQQGGAWTEEVLHSFAGITSPSQYGDGALPNGGLVLDGKGAVYGTTGIGGHGCKLGCGTVFQLNPPRKKGGPWIEKQIRIFRNGDKDGKFPTDVIFGPDGALYGGAGGGAHDGGIVFRLTTTAKGAWRETPVYQFSHYIYGPSPSFFSSTGDLYCAYTSEPYAGVSSVFRLRPPTQKGKLWGIDYLFEFRNWHDGANPFPQMARDKTGDLYGATVIGGGTNAGVVFELEP